MDSIFNLVVPALIAVIIFIVVFLVITIFSKDIENKMEPVFGKYLKYLELEFSVLEIPISARDFIKFQVALCILLFVVGLVIGDGTLLKIIMSIAFAYMGFFITRIYITQMKNRRKLKFEEQFVDAIALISNAVRSGLSLMQSMELTVKEMENPVSYEINLVIQTTRLGVPLDIALVEWAERIDSKDLDIFVTALIIQSQTGGNLSDILETLGKTIRERFRIQRQIKTLTSQGVMSAYILTLLPVILGVVLFFIQPETMSLLFTTQYGLLLIGVTILMISIGGFIVRKIITIDI